MAFSGKSTNEAFAVNQVAEDVAAFVAALSPKETEILDFLGDSDRFATSTKHEYWQDYMLPNYIVNSTAVASATAATAVQINGHGNALTVGTLLELAEGGEVLQVNSILGPNTINVTRHYGATASAVGSLAAGGSLYVRAMTGLEGQDHNGSGVRRLGDRQANTVGYFNIPFAASGTQMSITEYGNDSFESAIAKGLIDVMHQLEKEVLRGVLNAANSLGSTSASRTMQGLRGWITTVNSSAVPANSFAANPHLFIGDLFQAMYQNGASPSDDWALVGGYDVYRAISDMNDTKVQDSQQSEEFKRVIRRYTGPFGTAQVILGRVLSPKELLLIPRERVKVVPLQGRSFQYETVAKTGDNSKGFIVGEYTIEVHHESAMARMRTS